MFEIQTISSLRLIIYQLKVQSGDGSDLPMGSKATVLACSYSNTICCTDVYSLCTKSAF